MESCLTPRLCPTLLAVSASLLAQAPPPGPPPGMQPMIMQLSVQGQGSGTLPQGRHRPATLAWKQERPVGEAWKLSDLGPARGVPQVDGSELFVMDQGALHCLDLAQGKRKWSAPLPGKETWLSPLTLSADRVFYGTSEYQLVALDRRTGAQVWKAQLEKHIPHYDNGTRSQPVSQVCIGKDRVFVGTWGLVLFSHVGELHALDLASGKALWSQKLKDGVDQAPFLAGDKVLARGGRLIAAFSAESGAPAGQFPAESGFQGPAVKGPDRDYFCSDGWLQTLNPATGEAKKLVKTTRMVTPFPAEGLVAAAQYGSWGKGTPLVIDPATGKALWESKERAIGDPVVQADTLVFPAPDKALVGLELRSGKARFRVNLPGEALDSPIPTPSALLVHCQDGKKKDESLLLALDPVTGAEAWRWAFPKGLCAPPVYCPEGIVAWSADGLRLMR